MKKYENENTKIGEKDDCILKREKKRIKSYMM